MLMKQLKDIGRSIVALKKQLRAAVKELNLEAGKLLARGKYEGSAALVDTAKSSREFISEVEALRLRWKALKSGGGSQPSGQKTPLWEYYGLVARALIELGGEATRGEISKWISEHGTSELKPADLARTARGRVIWDRNLGRAKRAMLKEGYLEPGNKWKLTQLGRSITKYSEDKA
jgi:hypothetical protein